MKINDVEFNVSLEDVLDELRSQLAINHIPYLQKDPKRSANSLQVQCPYHGNGQERKPSAGIRMTDGMYHCFACGEIKTLPEVISHCFGQDDTLGEFGWKWLLKNFATIQVEERKDVKIDLDRSVHAVQNHSKVNQTTLNWVTEEELEQYRFYHPYWTKRGITDERLFDLFDLGYDATRQAITFPVRDKAGHCLFVARRSVRTKYFNYPAGAEKPLYGLYEYLQCLQKSMDELRSKRCGKSYFLKKANEVIVCESMLDTLTCWQYGSYAVALNGLGTRQQFKELRELPCRKLILATDNDEAGMKARKRIRKNVTNKIITEYRLPEGKKDINELTKEEFLNLEEIF